jgi:Fic family protein
MLLQALRAYKYLEKQTQSGSPRTSAAICQVHGLLMQGAKQCKRDGGVAAIGAGQFRIEPVSAGKWTFPPHADVPTRLEEIVQNFENRLQELHAIEAATLLFYDVISLHPFIDGNGRLSRFGFAYALLRAGFPFPVILSSGASKEYKHYIAALQHAQGRGDLKSLYAMAWRSVERTMRSATDFLRLHT